MSFPTITAVLRLKLHFCASSRKNCLKINALSHTEKTVGKVYFTFYGAVLHTCNILFSTLLLSVVKLITFLCVFIAIFKLLLVHPHFLNYFFFIFASVMVRNISLTQGSEKPTYLFRYDIVSSHELVWYSFF